MIKKSFQLFLGIALLAYSTVSMSTEMDTDTFETQTYRITIHVHCAEGNISCDNVSYIGVRKKDNATITLKGETMNTNCKTGGCRFYGYEFKNNDFIYRIYEPEGILNISKKGKLIFSEKRIDSN
jgi:hypothetical protein